MSMPVFSANRIPQFGFSLGNTTTVKAKPSTRQIVSMVKDNMRHIQEKQNPQSKQSKETKAITATSLSLEAFNLILHCASFHNQSSEGPYNLVEEAKKYDPISLIDVEGSSPNGSSED